MLGVRKLYGDDAGFGCSRRIADLQQLLMKDGETACATVFSNGRFQHIPDITGDQVICELEGVLPRLTLAQRKDRQPKPISTRSVSITLV